MPFNFNAVNYQLDDKANIFAPAGGAQSGATDSRSASNFGMGSMSAPSAGGSKSNVVGQSQAGKPASGSGGAYNPAAAQKVYDSAGTGDYKPATDKIGGTIADANTKLQEQANAYTAKADTTAAGFKLTNDQLNGAASGDDAAFQTVASRLSKTQPDQFEAFSGLKSDEIPTAASSVSKPSIFGDIYRPTAGADYTNGQNSLNSMQLRRSGDFRNVAAQLGQDQESLIANNAKQQDELTSSTREKLGKAYTDATGEARSTLNNMGETIIKTAKDQELADEARRQGLDVQALSKAEFEKLKPQIQASMKAAGLDRSMSYLDDPANFSELSKYLKLDTDVDYTDFMDEAGAGKYNRINSLLGNGNALISPTAKDDDYSFDVNGATSYIGGVTQGKRQEADRGLQSQIDALLGSAGKRATGDQGDALKNAQDYVTRKYLDQNEGQSGAQLQAEQEAYRQMFNPETNWNPYYTSAGGLSAPSTTPRTAQDMLSPQEAAQLNELTKQLGSGTTYTAGSAYNTPNFNQQYFDDLFSKNFGRISGEIAGTSPMTTNGQDRIVNPIVEAQEREKAKAASIAQFNRALGARR